MRRPPRRAWAAPLVLATTILARPEPAAAQAVWLAPDGLRVLADRPSRDAAPLRIDGREDAPAWTALRGEVAAFQVIVEAGVVPLRAVEVEVSLDGDPGVAVERFVEHYVEVRERSANEQRPAESLAWTPAARPGDAEHLGLVPDALFPVDRAPPFRPYPMVVDAGRSAAVWVDWAVAADAAPGVRTGRVVVTSADGELASIPIALEVLDAAMPYRAVSFFAYYGTYELESRFGAEPWHVERNLWQLLHAHHVDAVPSGMVNVETVERVRPALDGTLFTASHGYRGPGVGVPPGLVVLGPYGELGDASAEGVRRVQALVAALPEGIEDVVLYAVDEKCDSPRGPDWRRAIAAAGDPRLDRVLVAHTCSLDPGAQDVDLVMTTAPTFDPVAAAREGGPALWAYNGALPGAGPLVLDAPLTSLTADGWIAATYGVPRWFLWETTFWNDDNPGGRGPLDPFVAAATFHNRDGDRVLYDGLLVFPGQQRGRLPESKNHDRSGQWFEGLDAGRPEVFPSMRLKALRRGVQDAGLYALARAGDPRAADAIALRIVPRAMAHVGEGERTPWELSPRVYEQSRAELRRLIAPGADATPKAVRGALATAPRDLGRFAAPARGGGVRWRWVLGFVVVAALVVAVVRVAHRRRVRPT